MSKKRISPIVPSEPLKPHPGIIKNRILPEGMHEQNRGFLLFRLHQVI
jgi:hypothetical protein